MSDFDDLEDFDQIGDDPQFGGMSQEEVDRREAAFIKKVQQRITMLKKRQQFSAQERIEAAKWLGESGALDAIVPLVTVYSRDKTPGMKEAAAYALGQFKALEETLEDDVLEPMVQETLTNIILYEEFGRQAPIRRILLTQLGLVISAVVLFIIGAFMLTLPSRSDVEATAAAVASQETATAFVIEEGTFEALGVTRTFTPSPTPTPTDIPDRVDIQAGLALDYLDTLNADADILREQFNVIGRDGSGSQDCAISFNRPPAFEPSTAGAADETFSSLVDTVNMTREEIDELVVLYIRNCNNPAGLTQQQAAGSGSAAIAAQQTLVPARATLSFLNAQGPNGAAPQALTPTPDGPTDVPAAPTTTPTPAADADTLRAEAQTMQAIISELTAFRGPAQTLVQYWTDVQNTGTSAGCNQPPVTIQEGNYELELALQQALPPLAQAATNLNVALDLLRNGYAAFYSGCSAGNLDALVTDQLIAATTAQTALTDAQAALDQARAQLP